MLIHDVDDRIVVRQSIEYSRQGVFRRNDAKPRFPAATGDQPFQAHDQLLADHVKTVPILLEPPNCRDRRELPVSEVAAQNQDALAQFGGLQEVLHPDDIDLSRVATLRHPDQREVLANRSRKMRVEALRQPPDLAAAQPVAEHAIHVPDNGPPAHGEQVVEQDSGP